jgi:diguanylate cyclase (GGDEF)-like protein/PAS domain S-box-containing protein
MLHGQLPSELYRSIVEAAADPILLVDPAGRIVLANRAVSAVFEYAIADLLGQPVEALLPGDLRAKHTQHRDRYNQNPSARGMGVQLDLVALRANGSVVPVDVSLSPVALPEGTFVVCVVRDVSERRDLENKLRELSYRDVVTGLYSRVYLEIEIDRLDVGRRFPITCFMFDVDSMKQVNDQLGHQAGDDLLRRCANVLRSAFRAEDLIARIGGDEFAVVLPEVAEHDAALASGRVSRLLAQHSAAALAESVQMSHGWATGTAPPVRAILAEADARMYEAKRQVAQGRADRR